MPETILVTGAAGFIGFHCAQRLLEQGHKVVGLDSLNSYYDPNLKKARLTQLVTHPRFRFEHIDLADTPATMKVFERGQFEHVVHLAAQAGVRYSLTDPHAYAHSNLIGFLNILEGCRHIECRHLVYASSSSVYGANTKLPFRTSDPADHPISLYAATKKANEMMAHSYAHLFNLPSTGLRFFTVYGPWGRPDMAMWLFAKAIVEGQPIRLYNNGNMSRDFTYIDDITEAVTRLIWKPPQGDREWSGQYPSLSTSYAPWKIFNIGNSSPTDIMHVVSCIEKYLGMEAVKTLEPMQLGDVPATYADVHDLAHEVDFQPRTPIEVGIERFIDWYRDYHGV